MKHITLSILCIALLSFMTVHLQVQSLGYTYIDKGTQVERHQKVLRGQAGDPWQYRVLPEHTIVVLKKILKYFGFKKKRTYAFLLLRILQNILIFTFALLLYQALSLSPGHALIGIALLGWSMTYVFYDSDLQFSTYFDLLFYLLAALTLIKERYVWILPVTFFAALNRETSGLIPVLAAIFALFYSPAHLRKGRLILSVLTFLLYLAVFISLRLSYGEQEFITPYGHQPGTDIVLYNVTRTVTWINLLHFFNVLPFLALLAYPRWPIPLRLLALGILPVWFGIHLFCSVLAETRLLLVPQALVIIPAVLFLAHAREN